uniref:Uncharacterized protein n=1 Tax=Rhizophora mucronata TaxID=61149 RepID=A0A2P2JZ94_RHIMU
MRKCSTRRERLGIHVRELGLSMIEASFSCSVGESKFHKCA